MTQMLAASHVSAPVGSLQVRCCPGRLPTGARVEKNHLLAKLRFAKGMVRHGDLDFLGGLLSTVQCPCHAAPS